MYKNDSKLLMQIRYDLALETVNIIIDGASDMATNKNEVL
jgi:hypothetical protein